MTVPVLLVMFTGSGTSVTCAPSLLPREDQHAVSRSKTQIASGWRGVKHVPVLRSYTAHQPCRLTNGHMLAQAELALVPRFTIAGSICLLGLSSAEGAGTCVVVLTTCDGDV